MSARTKARKRAVDMLYAADIRDAEIAVVLGEEAQRASGEPDRAASWEYAREIVDGIADNLPTIDEALRTQARGWSLERMAVVDRAILRVAVWEILFNPDVPDSVAISEAVGLASELGGDDSAGFVNGVLAAVSAQNS